MAALVFWVQRYFEILKWYFTHANFENCRFPVWHSLVPTALANKAWDGSDEAVFSLAKRMTCCRCNNVLSSDFLGSCEHHGRNNKCNAFLWSREILDFSMLYPADSVFVEFRELVAHPSHSLGAEGCAIVHDNVMWRKIDKFHFCHFMNVSHQLFTVMVSVSGCKGIGKY